MRGRPSPSAPLAAPHGARNWSRIRSIPAARAQGGRPTPEGGSPMSSTTRILTALVLLARGLGAQAPQPVVIEGQLLPGGGTVTGIRYVHLVGDGFVVQVTTDQPQSSSAVLRQGGFTLGRPL